MNARQEEFCRKYVELRNATQAAIAAGYSEATARQQGSRLLTDVDILQKIRGLEAEWRQSSEINKEAIVAELKSLAFAFTAEECGKGEGEDPSQISIPFDEEFSPVIRRYGVPAARGVKARDKIAALSKLCDILGIGVGGGAEVNVNVNIADAIAEARKRAAGCGE